MGVVAIGSKGSVASAGTRTKPAEWSQTTKFFDDWYNKEMGNPKGERVQPGGVFQGKFNAVPRIGDLLTIRLLEKTHTISLPMDIITRQVVETEWTIAPKEDDADEEVQAWADKETEWLNGELNETDRNTFSDIRKMWVKDILSIDSGVIEKVFEDGYLKYLYPMDGMTVHKNIDKHGRLKDPAYIQYSMPHLAAYDNLANDYLRDLYRQHIYRFRHRASEPVKFSKDEIVFTEESPTTWYEYGFGRVQKAHRIAEIILNQDLVNRRYFSETEIPEGIMWIKGGQEADLQRVRQNVIESVKGEHHKIAVIGASEGGEFQPLRANNKEMQFLESNKTYNKLVWAVFGLSEHEVGIEADMNRATAEMADVSVYRKTTVPLLRLLENEINNKILPDRPGYDNTDGGIEFRFKIEHPELRRIEYEEQRKDLDSGVKTINEVLTERNEATVEWGDMTLSLYNQLVQSSPEWVFEHFVDLDIEPPEPSQDVPNLFSLSPSNIKEEKDEEGDNFFRRQEYKEALRNEYTDEHPDLKGNIDKYASRVEELIRTSLEKVKGEVERVLPESKSTLIPLDRVLSVINIAEPLLDITEDEVGEVIADSAEHDKQKVEEELSEATGEEVGLDISIDYTDTHAYEELQKRAAQNMTSVEDTVKEQVRTTIQNEADKDGGIQEIGRALDERVPEISQNHSRLIARTEVMNASRAGSQALAESTDLIAGKRWVATNDNRTRSWHKAMDETVIKKEDEFIVPQVNTKADETQPPDYPRETFIVGGDQPFNCRCSQRSVLKDDMPENLKALQKKYPEVVINV